MPNLNKVMLMGHVGKDPETKNLAGGTDMVTFSLATSEKWKDKNGEKQEATQWHNVTCFGAVAKFVGTYISQGDALYVEGSISYTKKDDKYFTNIRAFKVMGLSRREKKDGSEPVADKEVNVDNEAEKEDVPF